MSSIFSRELYFNILVNASRTVLLGITFISLRQKGEDGARRPLL